MHPEKPSDPTPRRVETPAGPVALTDVGAGPPVVALHGLPGSSRDFRWLGAAVEADLRFIRLELPGFGETPRRRSVARGALVETVVRTLDALGLDRAVLLAHSFSSGLVVSAAAEAPTRVAGVALIAPAGVRPHRGRRAFAIPPAVMAGTMATPGLGPVVRRQVQGLFQKAGFRCSPAEVHQTISILARWRFADTAAAARAVRCPVFAAWADDDAAIEPAVVEELLALVPTGPRLHFTEGGHNLQKSRATEIAEALIPWTRTVLS
ncbi:MAG: alpha/beta fold hydrolase [bacterium]